MTTAELLRKIKDICDNNEHCSACPLDKEFCSCVPAHWTDNEIGMMAITIDNYEEEDEDGN